MDCGREPRLPERNLRLYLCGACALQAGRLVAGQLGFAVVPVEDTEGARELYERAVAAEGRVVELEGRLEAIGAAVGAAVGAPEPPAEVDF